MKIGFVGCGNMATAIIGGILEKGILKKEDIKASTKTENSAKKVQETLGIECTTDNKKAVQDADVIFLAVKPQFCEEVIQEIKSEIKSEQVIISIAAGKKLEWLEAQFGAGHKIIRTMPNTPALLGEGMTGMAYEESNYSEEEKAVLRGIFEACGRLEVVDERMMDAVGCVSGCSPAYVYMFIEALADGAVKYGLPRAKAYQMAAQTVLGSAKMVLETGKHPGQLKDEVCSPGGTTIAGVSALEEWGFRNAVIKAEDASYEKGRKM